MNWEAWRPTYHEILREFGFSEREDEAARDELAGMLFDHPGLVEPDALRVRLQGRRVHVYGAAAGFRPFDTPPEGEPVIVADKGIRRLMQSRLFPDVIVTDLDGDVGLQAEANARGAIAVVHAHGDNREALRRGLPQFGRAVLGTCQCEPVGLVHNFGGFTDGDRACHLAAAMGATEIHLHGFDFEAVGLHGGEREVKARKLQWAARLIARLPVPVYLGERCLTEASTQA